MAAQVIEDDEVTVLQCGAQELLDLCKEELSIHGSINHHESGQMMVAQAGDKGCCLPIAEGCRTDAPATLRSTRPWLRVMLAVAQVSSKNTSFSTSIAGCASIHGFHATCTCSRSCSLA
jgi:hypothetical protein